eukprot:jgi/Botrbrau1/22193/Bobra.168_1s0025.1
MSRLMLPAVLSSLLLFPIAWGLSDSVCETTMMSWVSDSPHLRGSFPFYSQILSCTGEINIESRPVDMCLNKGRDCGVPAASAFCKYLGFEGAVPGTIKQAPAKAPTRSLTGEWCTSPGNYVGGGALNRTAFEALTASTAGVEKRCDRLTAVTCFRSREVLGNAYKAIQADAAMLQGVANPPRVAAVSLQDSASEIPSRSTSLPLVSVGGRKLWL